VAEDSHILQYKLSMNFDKLTTYISEREKEFSLIEKDRIELLEKFSQYIKAQITEKGKAEGIFICTHNSRRSHLSQVWAQVASNHYKVNFTAYSGGTEATAIYKSSVQAFRNAGMEILQLSAEANPVFAVKYAENAHPVICFSKVYSNPFNVQSDFAAVMTCDNADQNCPYIPEASLRIPIKYVDPKAFDGTDAEQDKYDERCAQIAREMLYVFSKI